MSPVEDQPVRCPHARAVAGATPGDGGCVCVVMERDQARADPILEGAPVGVFISKRDDPSTYFNLCAGAGEPVLSPDDLPDRRFGQGHFSACPIFAADKEIREANARIFAPEARVEVDPEMPGVTFAGEEVSAEELAELGLG